MKPSYEGFEAKKTGAFLGLPPVGAYVAEIREVRFVEADGDKQQRDVIELMIEIVEGEYKGRYMDVYNEQKERNAEKARYRGVFRLTPPVDGDEDWRKRVFEGNLWCVEQSNPGYSWDWDEKKLKGKKVGISVRKRLYNYTNNKGEVVDAETTEIGKFETVNDVRNGKCKPMKDRDQRTHKAETDGQNFTEVSTSEVSVPW